MGELKKKIRNERARKDTMAVTWSREIIVKDEEWEPA